MTALIPRAVLFGYPERTLPAIDPDGTRILYLAPHEGVLAVWVRTLGHDDDRVVAADPARPIRTALWSPDGARVLYRQDRGGDENFHLFAADPDGGTASLDLTPYDDVRVELQAVDPRRPERVLLMMNRRDPRLFDVWSLDPRSGEAVLDTVNPGNVIAFAEDARLEVRAGLVQRPDAGADLLVRDGRDAPWRTLASFDADDGLPQIAGFAPDGGSLYVITSAGAEAARLLRLDLRGGERTEILSDPQYDVGQIVFSPRTREPIAATIVRARAELVMLDAAYAADDEALRGQIPGDLLVTSIDRDDRRWIVAANVDAGSPSFWVYDRVDRRAQKLFDTRPAVAAYTLAPMEPISYRARDGLSIHGYLTKPADGGARLPAVLLVHGGPWARDLWGFNGTVQWLANRGYAVLQVNFRGSTGYGKAHLNAGDRAWASAMHTDLLDAKAWLVQQHVADPLRVGIMGASYGGYAVLAALAFEPLAFACGVDIVGPSNLNTLLASIPPYWETQRATFTRRMGDDPEVLATQSPLHRANEIRAPLLIGQGANDPRVKIAESDQIVDAMRSRELPVTYVVFEDEGHGFARPENARRFYAAVEAFLHEHLGGRMEPAAPDEAIEPYLR